jgi:glutamate-1-semialdehyde 2,1-aminomutase
MPDLHRTDQERDLLTKAALLLPGGSLGNLRLSDEYSFVVAEGRGSRVRDVSGNEYVDYLLGSGPMVLGHAHPQVHAAALEAMSKGTTFFTQNVYAIELAQRLVDAVPCAEQVRYTTSGTEATYNALRIARAYRKRDKVLKFEGGFHGMHDYSLMSLTPSGTVDFPSPEPGSAGIPRSVQETVLVAPFNDLETASGLIEQYHDDLAAVIVEPVQRILTPLPAFLPGLREITTRYDIPLVFDEVVTGFRLAYGGAQEFFGVTPDIAALGKIIGGGFPLAAVVGRKEIMDGFDSSAVSSGDFVPQIGTLSGNPVAAATGIATLDIMKEPGTYEAYRTKGAGLRSTLQRLMDEAEIPAVVSGDDVMFDVYFTDHPITDYRSTLDTNKAMNKLFDQTLLEHGIFKSPGKFYLGICHDDDDIAKTVRAFEAGIYALQD